MDRYAVSGTEPSLREVFDDPIVGLLMARDKVSQDDLKGMIERYRGHRAADLAKTCKPVGDRAAWVPSWVRRWGETPKRIRG